MIRQTIQAGHPNLKRKNKSVSDVTSPVIKKLIKDLTDTLYKAELIGIAAPQIAENYQVFVTHARNTKARKLGKEDVFRVFINPKITVFSKESVTIYEGCGSVVNGDLFGPVRRPREITVTALDEKGQTFSVRCDGILARVI
ncbi:peptide deformylase, partial [Candidatus Microgenomates bacterium]|nr:peptide deformylase [Candidatus Microgenomates bacterium]